MFLDQHTILARLVNRRDSDEPLISNNDPEVIMFGVMSDDNLLATRAQQAPTPSINANGCPEKILNCMELLVADNLTATS